MGWPRPHWDRAALWLRHVMKGHVEVAGDLIEIMKGKRRSLSSFIRRLGRHVALAETVIIIITFAAILILTLRFFSGGPQPASPSFAYSTTDTLVRTWSNPKYSSGGNYREWKSTDARSKVLILTPMKDSSKDLQLYFSLLDRILYPKHLISLGILEGDSSDDTYDRLLDILEKMSTEGELRRITLIRKDFKLGNKALAGAQRHGFAVQGRRRAVQAKCRNHLQSIALDDEDMVLWIDSDLRQYPADIIDRMLKTGKRIVSADCIQSSGACYDRNNWRETPKSLTVKHSLGEDVLMFEGYPQEMMTYRESLCDIGKGPLTNLTSKS